MPDPIATPAPGSGTKHSAPRAVEAAATLYLIALLLLAGVWLRSGWPSTIGGLPVAVAWFGSLGTVSRSLDGLFWHARASWDHGYDLWHVLSPLLGLVTGVVTYALLAAGLATLGSAGTGAGWGYYVAAFLTGYNNDLFRALLAKAGHSLLGTPGAAASKAPRPGVPLSLDPTDAAPTNDQLDPHA